MKSRKIAFRRLSLALVLVGAGIAFGPVSAEDESYNGLTLGECYTIQFRGYELDDWGNSVWRYLVTQEEGCKGLSNWVLELPGCYFTDVISAYPEPWEFVEDEHHTGLNGIKWEPDWEYEDGQNSRFFQIRVAGEPAIGYTQVGVKAGNAVYVSDPTHKVRAPNCQ